MRVAAFFDIDETLIAGKSMFDFLRFHLADDRSPRLGQAERFAAFERAAAGGGLPRAEANREYYRIYRGVPADLVDRQGREWFERCRRTPGFINPRVVGALVRHRLAGHRVVLVSGSFPACLAPLADALGAHDLLCTRPEVGADGLLTGEVDRSVIGPVKAAAMREVAERFDLSLPLSFGYGDHVSDLPLLRQVGHPVVVGTDPELGRHAENNRWLRLAGVAA
ncbi:HAD superfamily hydrolase (TIGR01490 family) [Actinokineospora baliensis]|uniref:HAD family hydrolase n=1 Tax=Actinokineospora baliensis TaxID=547056 RepID=UPI00195ADD42|nr:HAD family hydrolase [Actinokineospora baliensis]MBM7774652.1 HAD superfamily hydrolase (TIGR01490 family) [Actinokineospora baliensis]